MRRHVLFVHGFDPRGPAPYHSICVEAARAKGLTVTPRRKGGPYSARWELCRPDGAVAYETLRYDDIARGLWGRWSGVRRYVAALRVIWAFANAGVLAKLRRFAPPTFWAILGQALIPFAPLALALAATAAAAALLALGRPLTATGVLVAGVAAALGLWRGLESRFNLAWYTRSLAFMVEAARGEFPSVDLRAVVFARRLIEVAQTGEADEIVVVGHSIGAVFAVKMLARALELFTLPRASLPPITFLTLGQPTPIFADLDPSGAFGRDIAAVADAYPWIDVTSPLDSASSGAMPICDGAASRPERRSTSHFDADSTRWRRLLQPLEFHFLYLRAANADQGFDYVTLLTKQQPIAETAAALAA